MQQPVLPPKPTKSTTHNFQQPAPSDRLTTNPILPGHQIPLKNEIKLPFITIAGDHTIQLFNELTNQPLNTIPTVPVPQYVQWLPNSKIKELLNDDTLINGYVQRIYEDELKQINEKIVRIKESQHKAALELQQNYNCNGLVLKAEQTERLNTELHRQLKQFDHTQIEMYDALESLSPKTVAQHFNQLAKDSESQSAELINNALAEESLDSKQLKNLLDQYAIQRNEWHSNKISAEYLNRILR
jgi:hypothetical protein